MKPILLVQDFLFVILKFTNCCQNSTIDYQRINIIKDVFQYNLTLKKRGMKVKNLKRNCKFNNI